MDINNIIFKAMLAEAAKQVEVRCAKGAEIEEAIKATAEDMHLSSDEESALAERAMKSSKLNVEPAVVEDVVEETPAPTLDGNTMHFGSEDDLDSATGMLMFKGIPWKSKSTADLLVEFDDADTLKEAVDALKRKFDFVENTKRRVGVVEFDNLADYGKVMEYMKKAGMMIECRDMGALDEDIDLQEKMLSELEGQVIPTRSYAAIQKGTVGTDYNVVEDKSARAVVVRKRWR